MPRTSSRPEQFLSILRSEPGYISGQDIAEKVGISGSAVWKQIRRLRKYGYAIESLHGTGYRLAGQTDLPLPWELTRMLTTSFVGKRVIYREVADSTQSLAMALAEKDQSSHGAVVIAEQQESGRGRLKRKWLSPKGGLWLSVVLKPRIPVSGITLLPFVAALAVCAAIREGTRLDARLKWPNDVMIAGKKVAGILLNVSAEAQQINYAVIGIGVNANVDSSAIASRLGSKLLQQITSIRDELGRDANRLQLATLVLEKIESCYLGLEQKGARAIIQAWKKNSDMLGHRVAVMQNGRTIHQGVAADVNEDGSLLIHTNSSGDVSVVSGDIHVRY
jgi:BirA family biotin operon repressor/biotin-[acetyl-CoA-carboxylase] ligase